MKDILKIFKGLEISGVLIKGVIKPIGNETKESRRRFFGGFIRYIKCEFIGKYGSRKRCNQRKWWGYSRWRWSNQSTIGSKKPLILRLISRYKVLSKWIQYQRCFTRNYLLSIMTDVLYIVNLHECNSIGADCITLWVNGNNATYLISVELNTFPKKSKILSAIIIS